MKNPIITIFLSAFIIFLMIDAHDVQDKACKRSYREDIFIIKSENITHSYLETSQDRASFGYDVGCKIEQDFKDIRKQFAELGHIDICMNLYTDFGTTNKKPILEYCISVFLSESELDTKREVTKEKFKELAQLIFEQNLNNYVYKFELHIKSASY